MSPGLDNKELSAFLFRACHDLRGSVRAVRTQAELLLRNSTTPEKADLDERLGEIVRGAGRLDLLVDGLVHYSLALDTDRAAFQPVATQALVRGVLAKLDNALKEQGAGVSVGELPRVSGNPDRLMEVFESLVRNALVHRGAAAPQIHITAEDGGHEWVFRVADNGPGVGEGYLAGILKPFERLAGKKKDGPGLGLAIAKTIVERHGGKIHAESNGTGLTVVFTLPKA